MDEDVLGRIAFTKVTPAGDREHYVDADEIRVVLMRLPRELWQRLRAVHLNDRSRGARVLGYVNRGRREIALCALPPRISLVYSVNYFSPVTTTTTPQRS